MSDAFLLEMSEQDFLNEVANSFRLYRDCRKNGNLLALAKSLFAKSSLVEGCLLAGEPLSVDARARGMDGLLHWVVDKLRPDGVPSLVAPSWRSYHVLFYPYLYSGMNKYGEQDKWTFSRLAEAMALSEKAIYDARKRAIEAVRAILYEELNTAQDVAGRRRYLIERRYQAHEDDERRLLRLLSGLPEPIPLSWGHELAKRWQVDDPAASFRALLKSGLLLANENENERTVAVHAQARAHLESWLSAKEKQSLHQVAGDYYEEKRGYLQAVHHLRQGQQYERSASILIEHYQTIVDHQQIKLLRERFALFEDGEVSDLTWARLKIAAGDAAFLVEDVDTALEEYAQALGTSHIPTKALAYYRRGKAFNLKNIDECFVHYQKAIDLLEAWPEYEPLLADIYIDRAWPYFQEKSDLKQAEANFKRAQEVIRQEDKIRWVNLHNAWARLCYHQENTKEELKHRLQAWLGATETQDWKLKIKAAHNLGLAYVWDQQYEQGLVYLQEGIALTQQIGDRMKEGMFQKTIGACYFFQQQHQDAIRHYLIAHEIFVETGNRNWQGTVSHDLAEAYAEVGNDVEMKRYFAQAQKIVEELGQKQLLEGLIDLSRKYEGLAPPETKLNERELLVFEHVKQHGKIKKKECVQLLEVSERSAVRFLRVFPT